MNNLATLIIQTIAIYGICFGLQHKATILHGKSEFIDKMLKCTYCTGFHCAWLVYVIFSLINSQQFELKLLVEMTMFSFYGASMCYIIDTVIRYFESNIEVYEEIENE